MVADWLLVVVAIAENVTGECDTGDDGLQVSQVTILSLIQ